MAKVREQPEDRDRIIRARKTCLRLRGRFYADSTGPAKSPWPMERQNAQNTGRAKPSKKQKLKT